MFGGSTKFFGACKLKRPSIGFLFLGQTHTEYFDVSLCLSKHGLESHLIDLNNSDHIKWDEYSLINVRECRGYHLDPDFLHKVEVLENELGSTPITNSLAIIRAAIDKGKYLQELEQDGVDTIPTFWIKCGATATLHDVIRETGWNDLVMKPTISSTSAPGFFAKAEMGSIRFQRRKIFLAVIAFGGPRSSCSGRGAQLPFGTLCATGLRK